MAHPIRTGASESVAADWTQLTPMGTTKEYPSGTSLFLQGAPACNVYVIQFGVIKLINSEWHGKETIITLVYPGWILGVASAILGKPYPVTAVTLTPTRALCASDEDFCRLLRSDPEFSFQLHRMLSEETYEQITQLADLCLIPARLRLERLIRKLVATQKRTKLQYGGPLRVPLKNWEIAELIAVTPEHLSRLLRVMEREGVLQQEKGRIILLNPKIAA